MSNPVQQAEQQAYAAQQAALQAQLAAAEQHQRDVAAVQAAARNHADPVIQAIARLMQGVITH